MKRQFRAKMIDFIKRKPMTFRKNKENPFHSSTKPKQSKPQKPFFDPSLQYAH